MKAPHLSLVLSALTAGAFAASAADWQKRSIYQVVVDRFATSDGSSPPCFTGDRRYCGGTWDGLINKLDYIENMGFDAVWISPIVANVAGNTSYGEAYHGYWPSDINNLNPHFGTPDDLKNLVTALHGRGMYLMVDVVVNHMVALPDNTSASTAGVPALDYSTITPFGTSTDYHAPCFIQDYNNQTDVEQCWLGDVNLPLADLNTENQTTVDIMYQWIGDLVKTYDIDGLRIDTAKHIRKDFWPGFASAAGVFTIAEILEGSTDYTAPYTQVLDSILDYPTYFALTDGFKSASGNLSNIANIITQAQKSYKGGAFSTGAFLDNHDQPRFASTTSDQSLVRNAMVLPYIHDGIPIVYYGQEQGFQGASDPDNREALWLSDYVDDPAQRPLLDQLGRLNAARKAAISAPGYSFLESPMKFVSPPGEAPTIAISKPPLLALLTNLGNQSTVVYGLPDAGLGNNTAVIDILNCAQWRTGETGEIHVKREHGMPQVLMPASVLSAMNSTLCRDVVTKLAAGQGTDSGAPRENRQSLVAIMFAFVVTGLSMMLV
ncbi:alpha-amylase [Punctularia strigosozonata HHB-11173 SS5]|uniref:Alpha-amylase n=1 Tax=Punctularia strigosozonata (strain HHB-11173) TaxID=741275 RepID=R7RZN8_PUNST|nr:alpha-amylase [Punctularia strigosozonata HHB-11173 SS5]EIN03580.1 alpha-amylase [Punctularia strigosozonata HHB-11173 SS5]